MNTAIRTLFVTALMCLIASAAFGGPVSDKLTPEELERVKAGEVILKNDISEKCKAGEGVAFGVYRCSLDEFWKVVFDYPNYKDIFPRIVYARIRPEGKTDHFFLTDFSIDATLAKIEYVSFNKLSQDRMRLDFGLDEKFPHKYQKEMNGYWQLEKLGENVYLAEYKVHVALDIPLIGGMVNKIVAAMSGKDLPDVLVSIRKRIDSGGTWTRTAKK